MEGLFLTLDRHFRLEKLLVSGGGGLLDYSISTSPSIFPLDFVLSFGT